MFFSEEKIDFVWVISRKNAAITKTKFGENKKFTEFITLVGGPALRFLYSFHLFNLKVNLLFLALLSTHDIYIVIFILFEKSVGWYTTFTSQQV